MNNEEVRVRLETALRRLEERDSHLFENDLSERCIAARLALHLQNLIADYSVDVEYNRKGVLPKRLHLPPECGNYRNEEGEALVVPDIIVHRRGGEGPNVLALELKKTTNPESRECDQARVQAFREQLNYTAAALIECETRYGRKPSAAVSVWV